MVNPVVWRTVWERAESWTVHHCVYWPISILFCDYLSFKSGSPCRSVGKKISSNIQRGWVTKKKEIIQCLGRGWFYFLWKGERNQLNYVLNINQLTLSFFFSFFLNLSSEHPFGDHTSVLLNPVGSGELNFWSRICSFR